MGAGSTEEEPEELLLTSVTQMSIRKLKFGQEMQYFAMMTNLVIAFRES